MQRFKRSITVLLITPILLALPFSMAQADEEMGGEVDIPPPRSEPAPPPPPPPPPPAEEPVAAVPPPYLEMSSRSLAAGIGISWGEGTLAFEGVDHAFSMRGVSLLNLGAFSAEGLGEVYNLESLADFEGTYVAVEAAGAAGIGASTTRMRNQHGVEISLRSELQGVELALATRGFSIRFK